MLGGGGEGGLITLALVACKLLVEMEDEAAPICLEMTTDELVVGWYHAPVASLCSWKFPNAVVDLINSPTLVEHFKFGARTLRAVSHEAAGATMLALSVDSFSFGYDALKSAEGETALLTCALAALSLRDMAHAPPNLRT